MSESAPIGYDSSLLTSTKSSQHLMVPVLQLELSLRRAGEAMARRGRARMSAAENIILSD